MRKFLQKLFKKDPDPLVKVSPNEGRRLLAQSGWCRSGGPGEWWTTPDQQLHTSLRGALEMIGYELDTEKK